MNELLYINGFAPATLDELIENKQSFKEGHTCTIDGNA